MLLKKQLNRIAKISAKYVKYRDGIKPIENKLVASIPNLDNLTYEELLSILNVLPTSFPGSWRLYRVIEDREEKTATT